MKIEEAREIIEKGKTDGRISTSRLEYCHGFIEAHDQQEKRVQAYRRIAAKWAQQAQIETGEGLDPGFNHCLEVIDSQVEKELEK